MLNSLINLRAFHTSEIDDVVIGKSGMLIFNDTIPDFKGSSILTGERWLVIEQNIERARDSLNQQGVELHIAIAPNKNTIYPEFMPRSYKASETDGNIKRLSSLNIDYIDLKRALLDEKSGGMLYFLTDTHWNARGAAHAANAIFKSVGKDNRVSTDAPIAKFTDGDLARLLGLDGILAEDAPLVDSETDYSKRDILAEGDGDGRILVFRDSFGTGIAPMLTTGFEEAAYRWETPFDALDAEDFDHVLILIAERNIEEYLSQPMLSISPEVDLPEISGGIDADIRLDAISEDGVLILTAEFEPQLSESAGARFIARIGDINYWCTPVFGEDEASRAIDAIEVYLPLGAVGSDETVQYAVCRPDGSALSIGEETALDGLIDDDEYWVDEEEEFYDFDDLQRLRDELGGSE